MQSFRSEVFPDFFNNKISYRDKCTFIGSCFTEHIGNRLEQIKFKVLVNPFGILYNPVSVAKCINICLSGKKFTDEDILFFNEKWISFFHHGRFSGINKDEVLRSINRELEMGTTFLKESKLLFLTFGTSWVYKHRATNQVVSNCHKIPAREFERYSLNLETILDLYTSVITALKQFNPSLQVVLTVSPVRHWNDGAINNQRSKALLILAVSELVNKFDFIYYFPSYEIMMDDLRDYRFYADDFFHPNQLAINYIWTKFSETFLDAKALQIAEKVENLKRAIAHRPFYPNTAAYLKFIESNLALLDQLKKLLPDTSFEEESQYLNGEKIKYGT